MLTFWWLKNIDIGTFNISSSKKVFWTVRDLCGSHKNITVEGALGLELVFPQHHFLRSLTKQPLYLKINYAVTKHLCSLNLWEYSVIIIWMHRFWQNISETFVDFLRWTFSIFRIRMTQFWLYLHFSSKTWPCMSLVRLKG